VWQDVAVAMKRPLDQRFRNSPVLTMIAPSILLAGSQRPVVARICNPGSSVTGSRVRNPWSRCGAMPNWLSSAATGG